ncbi:MAG: acetyl-CoA decarbonylase/synthase complex subunit gamma, partial [Nitrospirae bacterium]|nr:acetyl-CoA decarbonylase/synthase complex subunit gamma [Nitrospirota bacterium]
PTCLAFAMKLAQRQVELDLCPDASDEAKKSLGEASAPPIRPVTMGQGEKAVKAGEELSLFRHEKKFIHPTVITLGIKDTESDDVVAKKIGDILSSEIDRVGQKLRIDAVAIINESGDAGKFDKLAVSVADKLKDVPAIICTSNPDAARLAIAHFSGKNPILYGANAVNADAMAALAKEHKAILGVKAEGLDALTDLVEKFKGLGIVDMVLDSGAKSGKEIIEHNTLIRRAAIKKGDKSVGFPVINFVERSNPTHEAMVAGLCIAKYGGIVVINSAEKWKNLVMFAIRQNIFTDPQVPMQVKQNIYDIGAVSASSPLLISTNFSLTYFIVSGEIENSKIPTRLAVMDCEGLSVLTAWAAGKFTAAKIAEFIKESGIGDKIATKELILPGYVAILSGSLEDKLEGWKITVGPREANAIPAYLKSRAA